MSNKLIDIVNISKAFDENVVLDELNLYIRENEFLTLQNKAVAEKQHCFVFLVDSRLLTLEKSSSMVRISRTWLKQTTVKYRIQKYALFTHMSIAENIAFGLKIKGKSQNYINDKIRYALKLVNLEGFENRTPCFLKRRTTAAYRYCKRAIVNEPKVLLLDEPLGALDLKASPRYAVRTDPL